MIRTRPSSFIRKLPPATGVTPMQLPELRWIPPRIRSIAKGGLLLTVSCLGIHWLVSPSNAELVEEGRELFTHEWTPDDPLSDGGDGLGPVFNERSCVACHFRGGIGGAGGRAQNVTTFQVLPNPRQETGLNGVVHAQATDPTFEETKDDLEERFPDFSVLRQISEFCTVPVSFEPLSFDSINTPALFGVGLIDDISSGAIRSNLRGRSLTAIVDEFNLDFESTPTGRLRTHSFRRVGRFGWKGQFASLEEFVGTACAVELGLTNRVRAQDAPHTHRPDEDAEYDMSSRQLDALVAYCRSLPRPQQIIPADPVGRFKTIEGERLFTEIGCADCHTPTIDGIDGIYSDFALHILEPGSSGGYADPEAEFPIPDGEPRPEEWQTPPLWGVADTAPYFHDGGSPTLKSAILRHGAHARHVTEKFDRLSESKQGDIIAFLKSLRAPRTAETASVPDKPVRDDPLESLEVQ